MKQLYRAAYYFVVLANIVSAHATVKTLTEKSFNETLLSTEDALWLIKFYAPWCRHCQKLAPVLDEAATRLSGKLAIGKVDCVKEKSLCDKNNVAYFPTLKYYRHSKFEEYFGAKDVDSIAEFVDKMNSPTMQSILNYEDVIRKIKQNEVSFIAYEPAADKNDDGYLFDSTPLLKVFGEVAKDYHLKVPFYALGTQHEEEIFKNLFDMQDPHEPFIARVEEDVEINIFTGEMTELSLDSFVKKNMEATIPQINEGNIQNLGYREKFMAILVVNTDHVDKTRKYFSDVKRYISRAPSIIHEEYQFAWIDANQRKKNLEGYSIPIQDEPMMFCLEYPYDFYWTSPYSTESAESVHRFLTDILENRILAKDLLPDDPDTRKPNGLTDEYLYNLVVQYSPWSFIVIVCFTLLVFLPPTCSIHNRMMEFLFDPILRKLGLLDLEDKETNEKNKRKKD